ncbi:hypothetical protein H4R34_000458 [Dimargaris verticillata]|uniref:rRNA adenine N(6)-methyltransferase n=1 Tax=Dimargaris verticillata TaxID=2761393 RepID=A0A9W8BBR8_9FUNG|nr:hypothetical protein H4R34_000458 [Dimargaris verticillata]
MKPLPRLPTVRDLIKLYGLGAKSQLGQNFILDKNVTDKIVRCADISDPDSAVLEVGPGPGLLTRSLLETGVRAVIAVEKDARFLPSLNQLADATDSRLKIINEDVLKLDYAQVLEALNTHTVPGSPVQTLHIMGNLPFNIATPLLLQWLHALSTSSGIFGHMNTSFTLMFQKELAERLVAPPGTGNRGRLSITVQSLCHAKMAYQLPSTSFVPRPKVDAGVVHLTPRPTSLLQVPLSSLEYVMRFFFSYRRKTLGRIIKNLDAQYLPWLDACDLDPQLRPQDLTNEQANQLAKVVIESKVAL